MKQLKLLFLAVCFAVCCGCSQDNTEVQPQQTSPSPSEEAEEIEETEDAEITEGVSDYSRLMKCSYYNEDMFYAYNRTAGEYETQGEVICGVAPHHLTAGYMIAGMYKSAAESRSNVETVVIVAPLHYVEKGTTCTSKNGWATPFGALESDKELTDILINELGAETNDKLMEYDHAVSSHIPFIKYYFPEAKAAYLLISPTEAKSFPEKLADTLYEMSEKRNCLFVFSIDFSHYLSPEEAKENDAETLEAVLGGDTDTIEKMTNDNVDTPFGLSAYVRLSELFGGEISCSDNQNTQKIVGLPYSKSDYPEGVTSYFVYLTTKMPS